MKLVIAILAVWALFAVPRARAYEDEVNTTLVRFSDYRPVYFLVGHPDTKIEVSFKAQVVEAIPLYFAYTQLMAWELLNRSPYFQEIDYSPEAFYRIRFRDGEASWLDVCPFLHESNGKGGDAERSWDRAYVRYQWSTSAGSSAHLLWSVQGWVPYLYSRNSDLPKYRGLGEFVLTWADFLGPDWDRDDLTLRLYLGGAAYVNPAQGGQELTLRMKAHGRAFLPTLLAQVFHGYAEDLYNYQASAWGLRAGIGF